MNEVLDIKLHEPLDSRVAALSAELIVNMNEPRADVIYLHVELLTETEQDKKS